MSKDDKKGKKGKKTREQKSEDLSDSGGISPTEAPGRIEAPSNNEGGSEGKESSSKNNSKED